MTDGAVRAERLAELRRALMLAGLHGWIIGREDMYQGEEVPAGDERLAFISGFTGSAGFAVVLRDRAALFSDGRYSLQMTAQTDQAAWECHTLPDVTFESWLAAVDLPADWVLGIDGRLTTLDGFEKFERAVLKAGGSLASCSENPIDRIWKGRPRLPAATPWPMPDSVSGKSMREKLAALDDALVERACEAIVLTRVDSVNWLINQRGRDLEFTPVTLCFAFYARQSGLCLLGDPARLAMLRGHGVAVRPLDDLGQMVDALGDAALMIEPASLPYHLHSVIAAGSVRRVKAACPITRMKARKTAAELAGFRAAHRRDGVAMVEFLTWLAQNEGTGLAETALADKLLAFRQNQPEFIAPSFATIAGSGPNGAIVHYRAVAGVDRHLEDNDLLLLDSGAHYRDGTTDITRTIAIGTPPDAAATAFTHVLKAHVSLAQAVFPIGTTGQQLDAVARAPLWAARLDFAHGTGHGVGHVLSVHEGPASISKRGTEALQAGMILSNEPGCYRAGAFGVRIENLMAVTAVDGSEDGFLAFETLTLCPLDRRLIVAALLDPREIAWVNDYHARVREALFPHCSGAAQAWLATATAPI